MSPGQTSIIAQRLQRNAALLKGANILWVDDRPEHNDAIASILSGYGAAVRRALDTEGALTALRAELPDVVISDMERNGNWEAGKELAERTIAVDRRLRPVIFVANLQPGVPHYASGVTNRPDDLLHLVLDQLERVRSEP